MATASANVDPNFSLKYFTLKDEAKVCYIDEERPNHFFVNFTKDDDFTVKLPQMQIEMNAFYMDLPLECPKYFEKGDIAVCNLESNYKRVKVISADKAKTTGTYVVRLLDYGGQRTVFVAELMLLDIQFTSERLRWQAYHCVLAHIVLDDAPKCKKKVLDCFNGLKGQNLTCYVHILATCGDIHAVNMFFRLLKPPGVQYWMADDLIRRKLAYRTASMFGNRLHSTDS